MLQELQKSSNNNNNYYVYLYHYGNDNSIVTWDTPVQIRTVIAIDEWRVGVDTSRERHLTSL